MNSSLLSFCQFIKVKKNGNTVSASWNALDNVSGYRLNYAPYPNAQTIYSIDMNHATDLSVILGTGNAFYIGITSYNGNCNKYAANC
jgi:hypothetical protein